MYKLITGFVLLNIIMILIDGISLAGGHSFATTRLTVAATEIATTLTVSSTDGFLEADIVRIQDEQISYNGKTATTFTNCVRGYNNTEAAIHSSGLKVYGSDTDWLNAGLGFNIVSTGASVGEIDMITTVIRFFSTTIPKMVVWNYSFLKVGLMQYLRIILVAISIGFVIYMGIQIAMAIGGVLQSIFNRP